MSSIFSSAVNSIKKKKAPVIVRPKDIVSNRGPKEKESILKRIKKAPKVDSN